MNNLSPSDISRIIEMTWEDRTPFEAIEIQFGLKENDLRDIMRREMKPSSFKMWRKRVCGKKTKHLSLRSKEVNRFKSKNQ
ncbi:MAG: TIGR03643 family protein [Ignavibacterium sp.]|nr:TIGR03643 family protein [Ignavibacterium sp.]